MKQYKFFNISCPNCSNAFEIRNFADTAKIGNFPARIYCPFCDSYQTVSVENEISEVPNEMLPAYIPQRVMHIPDFVQDSEQTVTVYRGGIGIFLEKSVAEKYGIKEGETIFDSRLYTKLIMESAAENSRIAKVRELMKRSGDNHAK